jgi:hypothetical protein
MREVGAHEVFVGLKSPRTMCMTLRKSVGKILCQRGEDAKREKG